MIKKPTSHPKPPKTKKNPLEKNSLYFWKQNFLVEILKNSYILSKESISYIFEHGTLHFFSPSLKIFYILETESCVSESNFPSSKMFFVFQEMKVFNPKLKNSCFVFRRTPSGFSLLFL